MNDSISRQAAIDALHGWEQCYTWDESCKDAQNVVSPSKVIEGLAPAKSDSDAEFWENRAAEYSKIIASLVADMSKGINFESMQITEAGKITFGRAKQEVIHCGDCKYKDDGIDEDGIPFLKCLNGRSYGGTRINDFCSWAERRSDEE